MYVCTTCSYNFQLASLMIAAVRQTIFLGGNPFKIRANPSLFSFCLSGPKVSKKRNGLKDQKDHHHFTDNFLGLIKNFSMMCISLFLKKEAA